MKLYLQTLENRDVPATYVESGSLLITANNQNQQQSIIVTEDVTDVNVNVNGTISSFSKSVIPIDSIVINGARLARNFIKIDSGIDTNITGGNKADVIIGGTGVNEINPKGGNDIVSVFYGIGVVNVIGQGVDQVYANQQSPETEVLQSSNDRVVYLNSWRRQPNFIGMEEGILYISPFRSGTTSVTFENGDTTVTVNNGTRVFENQKPKFIAYLGNSTEPNTYINDTNISDVAFGGSDADVFLGGRGASSFLSGGDGNDFLVGSSRFNILDGGSGVDTLFLLQPWTTTIDVVFANFDVQGVFGFRKNDVVTYY